MEGRSVFKGVFCDLVVGPQVTAESEKDKTLITMPTHGLHALPEICQGISAHHNAQGSKVANTSTVNPSRT